MLGFLTNELEVASYELRVTFYVRVTSHYFLSTCYRLVFTDQLILIIYWTSTELAFTYELPVPIYCATHELPMIERITSIIQLKTIKYVYEG